MTRKKSTRSSDGASHDSAPSAEDGATQKPAIPPWIRALLRMAAIGAVSVAAWILIWGPTDLLCETVSKQVVDGGATTTELTKSCAPIGPSLNDVLPFFVLAALLLLGELAEFSIPGLLTLKTRVQTQEERQDEVEKQLAEVRLTANQNQSLVQHFGDGSYQNPKAVSASAQAKADSVLEVPLVPTTEPHDSGELAALKYRVLEAYEVLNPFVIIAQNVGRGQAPELYWRRLPAMYRPALERLSMSNLDLLADWYERFKREIDFVRSVRNSVAHPPALVNEDDLKATLETLDTLRNEFTRLGFEGATRESM